MIDILAIDDKYVDEYNEWLFNYSFETAVTADEGIEKAKELQPKIIIIDNHMPKSIPADASEEYRRDCMRCTKPCAEYIATELKNLNPLPKLILVSSLFEGDISLFDKIIKRPDTQSEFEERLKPVLDELLGIPQ